ncbi:formin-like protein 13 isoform X1 [Vicia villosa]|uniref:formin-like protein 13 isoform X1 n=1 Tax=Vicia villosa TaxID=3911 RepID=UPI00273BEFCA|nr:formin-like protein 13 isoform X1 [Vicia villosa]XP_058754201.1 formin-like protein 13 isoform X1 [Vicia villosa]
MAMLRKLFFRKPPDGLLEICERVYVFDCCFTTEAWNVEKYKVYVDGIVGELRENVPDASIMVFNFREEQTKSLMANVMSEYDITIMDYPRHYEGCPVLKMELVHHFLRSSESWLSLGQHNVLLMHCERGGWPVLAFMLAALLIFRKVYSGEHRTLDMVYRQSPHELLHLLTPLNPIPSQLRYLQYVSRRNVALDWPPLDRALMLDCIILRFFPNFDGKGGCHPLFRIYGQDPFSADKSSKMLYSMPKRSKNIRAYKQGECELIKIDINCHIQGDVVIEGVNLNDDLEREMMMFRVMFNTAFVRSNILMLNRDEIDVLWDARDHFPKDFRAEILFSEMDAAAAVIADGKSCFEEKEGLPIEAFAKVQEIFSHADWMNPKADAALNVLQHISTSAIMSDKLDKASDQHVETATLLRETDPKTPQRKNSYEAIQSLSSTKRFPNNDMSGKEDRTSKVDAIPQRDGASDIICRETICSPERSLKSSKCPTGSTNLDIKLQAPNLASPGSMDSSLSPETPPPRPPSPIRAKEVHDSPPHTESPPDHILPLQSGHQSQGRSYSPTSSSTPGNQLLSAVHNKSPPAAIVSPPSHSAVSSTQPPPPLSSKTPSNEIPPVKTRLESSPSQPLTPPHPPTPPLKDHKIVRAEPPSPHPSQPPPKKELHVETEPPPVPSPMNEKPRDGISPSPPPLKAEQPVRFKPQPPPPPPSLSREAACPTPPSLSREAASPTIAPPAPPPPRLSREAASPTIGPPAPPPPPSATLSSSNPNPSLQKCPPVPPPPIPFGKEGLKPGGGFPMSLSVGGDANNVSGTSGNQSSSLTGSKGRVLSKNNSKKLKPLHWMKLSRAVQGSLWDETQKSGEASKAPEIDMSELENLFSAAAPSSGLAKKSNVQSSVRPKSEKVQLIEHRRACNCEIMLSKVKVPLHDLMSSVLALEESLDVDQVENLIKFCPTKEEMEIIKSYNGEKEKLGRCEQFFMELMKVPRVESKLRVFLFKIQFHSQVSDLKNSLNAVNAASEEIRSSVKLKRIMQTILTLGNALNQGTARGSAIGFRLDTLLKLTETRARNNKMTLMHYLCKVLDEKLPEVLDFSKDLANLEPAAKIQLKFLAEEMQAINKGLEKIVQELSTSENDGPISEKFRKKLKDFLCSAEAEVRALASLYSGVGRNVDALILYFGEDPSRCPFEQVVTTLLNFTQMFNKAHEENCKQLELEMKKTADSEKKKCESERILPKVIRTGNVK